MIWPAATLAWVGVESHGPSPVLDHPYRFVTEDVRDVAGQPRRFVAERRIVFRRDGDTLVAEVTLEKLETDAPAEVGHRFLIGSGGLKGRTVRFHLAADGSVTGIDDEPAVWAATLAAVSGMAPKVSASDPRGQISRDPAAALASLTPERRRQAIASIVAGLFADPATLPLPGKRAVRIPARTLPGEAVLIDGEQVVDTIADGMLRLVTRAANDRVGIVRTRVIDPASGLLVSEQETTSFSVEGHPPASRSSKRTLVLVP